MNPQIVVNGRFLNRPVTGVERYAHSLTRWMGGQVQVMAAPNHLSGFAGHVWEQAILPQRVGRHQLLWSPANTGPLRVENQVITLHDVNVLEHPEWYSSRFASGYAWLLPRLAAHVLRIFTVSDYSRQQIHRVLGIGVDKIEVIPPGMDLERFRPPARAGLAAVLRRYHLPKYYVLHVGTLAAHKNLDVLLAAWGLIREKCPGLELILAGGESPLFRSLPFDHLLAGVRRLGYVAEEHLPALYGGALASVIPSRCEGFGYPAIEAMACGTPVVAAATGGLPETVGSAGRLVDPDNPTALAAAFVELFSDNDLRQDYITRGLARAACFSDRVATGRVLAALKALGNF